MHSVASLITFLPHHVYRIQGSFLIHTDRLELLGMKSYRLPFSVVEAESKRLVPTAGETDKTATLMSEQEM